MKKNFLLFIILLGFSMACSKKEEKKEATPDQIDARNLSLDCLRWIDRDLYFSTPDPFNSSVNNQFHKEQVRTAIKQIELNTNLGEDYFRIKEVNPDLLDPIRSRSLPQSEYKSFVLIWNDDRFERFVIDNLCDPSVKAANELACLFNLPDRNAIVVTNPNFKRKYYMIFRASCFEAGSRCLDPQTNQPLGFSGLQALIARQFGFLVGLTPVCSATEDPSGIPVSRRNNVMCRFPADNQWNENVGTEDSPSYIRREGYFAAVNSQLAVISSNINYYQDAEVAASCLSRPWMDQTIYPACPKANGNMNNTQYQIFLRDIKDTLDEISANTLLGLNYFKFPTQKDPQTGEDNVVCTNENSINLVLERQDNFEDPFSYLFLWDDYSFNDFVNINGIAVPDMNGFSLVNAAWKNKFKLILRASCFIITDGQPSANCYAGNSGVVESGASPSGHYKALIGRQIGFMTGLSASNCNDNPMDVMCVDVPNKEQWSEKYKKRFFNKLNNYLEVIGNDPSFYKQIFEEIENTADEAAP